MTVFRGQPNHKPNLKCSNWRKHPVLL